MYKNETEATMYLLANNGTDVWHPVELQSGGTMQTGQPNVDEFDSYEEMIQAIPEEYRPKNI